MEFEIAYYRIDPVYKAGELVERVLSPTETTIIEGNSFREAWWKFAKRELEGNNAMADPESVIGVLRAFYIYAGKRIPVNLPASGGSLGERLLSEHERKDRLINALIGRSTE